MEGSSSDDDSTMDILLQLGQTLLEIRSSSDNLFNDITAKVAYSGDWLSTYFAFR